MRNVLTRMPAIAAFAIAVTLASLPSPARAARLTRILVYNTTWHCMEVGVQRQGPHPIERFGGLRAHETFDHTFYVPGDVTPNYYIEVQLENCTTHRPIAIDVHITDHARDGHIITLKIVPRGSGYQLVPWP